ncbi:hypothetical protein GW17_00060850, partial [Ensete ventricosum]
FPKSRSVRLATVSMMPRVIDVVFSLVCTSCLGGPPRSPWADVSRLTCQDDVVLGLAWSELSGCRDGRSYSPRSDMSRLTGWNNVAADVILGPTWYG